MTFAVTAASLAYSAKAVDDIEVFAATPTTGWLAKLEDAKAGLAGVKARQVTASWDLQRRRLAAMVTPGAARSHYAPLLDQFADDISWSPNKNRPLWAALYDYMRTLGSPASVKSRDLTFGSSTFSGTGTGTLTILSVDEQGHEMQGVFADAYTLECTTDTRGTQFYAEDRFELAGTNAALDGLNMTGVGSVGSMKAVAPRDGRNLVQNPMWTQSTVSGGFVTALGSKWSITGSSNLELDTTNLYWSSGLRGVSTYNTLKFVANATITQDLVFDARKKFDLNKPYFNAVLLRRNDLCDGTLDLDFGAQSRSVTVSGLANNEWHLVLVPASTGQNNWFANLNQNSMQVSIELSSRTTGSLSVAAVWCVQMERLGHLVPGTNWGGRGCMGHYHMVIPAKSGASAFTPFVAGDNWTYTYSEGATRGKIQYWAARSALGYMRHDPSPTIADQ